MIKLGAWANLKPMFVPGAQQSIAGVSGGSTSGMMAALLSPETLLSFQNTSREAKRTYDFLSELEEALGRPIRWLEYRGPKEKGGRPCESRVEVVDYKTADRSGAVFEEFINAINAFRAKNGKGPIAPWWRSRICTTYMKTRTARNYVNMLGWTKWDEFVGLRADEPTRVAKLRIGVPKRIGRIAPLAEAKITKADVGAFWSAQSFSLGLDPIMGNCTGCFLKDQADLSRALLQPETDAAWWARIEAKHPGWGGKNFVGYGQLLGEAPTRLAIEAALSRGDTPVNDGLLDAHRFKLVVIQEKKRLAGQVKPFSCECEGSQQMADFDTEEEENFILGLPDV